MLKRVAFVLIAAAIIAPMQAKSLYWRAIDVNAQLDAEGKLHVRERQDIVFDGDWNGAERRFNVRDGQSLDFHEIRRITPDGEISLIPGTLANTDGWDYNGPNDVRWRARMPSDPPFRNQLISYVLIYTLDNVITTTGGNSYDLRHDFAFPDREGTIERITVHLDIDPAWQGARSPIVLQHGEVKPGKSFVLLQHLTYAGKAQPHALKVLPEFVRWLLVAAILLITIVLALIGYRHALATTAADPPPESIDQAWLDRYVFALRPQLLAAAFENEVGANAVAALLAQMSHEGKVTTQVKGGELHMHLNVPEQTLTGYERTLVDALFLGQKETSTPAIRRKYSDREFRPASLIREGVRNEVEGLSLFPPRGPRRMSWGTLLMLLVAGVAMYFAFDRLKIFTGVLLGTLLFASSAAVKRNQRGGLRAVIVPLLWLAPLLGYAIYLILGTIDDVYLFAVVAATLFVVWVVARVMQSPMPLERVPWHRRWMRAKEFFERELERPLPRLRDDWYPWMLALGLGANVDRWFDVKRRTDNEPLEDRERTAFMSTATSSSSGTTTASEPRFTGGGGAFGGAGASGGWSTAIGSMAAGVAAPVPEGSSSGGGYSSDSSSSTSSSSSSSSSGGGGGGGW